MNTIPEERALNQSGDFQQGGAGSTGTWTRSGIRMGSGLLLQPPPSAQGQPQSLNPWYSGLNPPSFKQNRFQNEANDEEDEISDWENEVSEKGELFYVVPYTDVPAGKVSGTLNPEKPEKSGKSGGKLSRLVRRRESKRERVRVQSKLTKKKLLKEEEKKSSMHNYESSDNDSSR